MATYRIIYGIVLAAALAFSQMYAGHLSSVILITVLVLPCISLIMTVISRFAFKLRFDGKREVLCKGSELYIRIPVSNRFIFPFSSAVIEASMPTNQDNKRAVMVFSLAPLQSRLLKITVPLTYRGEYDFTLERVVFWDMFRIFKIAKKLKLSKKVLVVPRLFEVQGGQTDFTSAEDDTRFVSVNSEAGERSFVRKYTDGDDVRRIHWKLSSKQEDYMVWQNTKGQASEISVLCDMTNFGADRADAIIEAGLAVCLYNLKSGKVSALYCYDRKLSGTRAMPIHIPEALYAAQEETATLCTYEPEPYFPAWARSVFSEKGGEDSSAAVVLITCTVTPDLAKLVEELSAESPVAVLLTGGSEGEHRLSRLKNVRHAVMNPENIQNEISKAILTINGI
ncbi:MAG: DUF58 domain-containing protein [Oscillospiraceae bacterium]|nr:DUF58 domain-containing protein [Oscillospiraceae bacterium]